MKVKCINDDGYESYLTKNKIYRLVRESEDWYYIIDNNNNIKSFLKFRFELLSESEINNIANEIVNIAKEIAELVEKKDKDYNSAFSKTLKEYGDVAYFLRIDDKLNRLKSLLLRSKDAEINESVEDTLKDIVGYTLLMLKEKRA